MGQPIVFPDKTVMLPIQFFGSIDYYAVMAAYGTVLIDDTARFDKRFKSAHRTTIADTRGLLQMTVPTAKQSNQGRPLLWSDIPLSEHGHWWDVHFESIASAYGRTPFFEFYADRLRAFFSLSAVTQFSSVAEYDKAINKAVCGLLGLENRIIYISEQPDCRNMTLNANFTGAGYARIPESVTPVEYYQVRSAKFGFLAGLSILDLLCNTGPESVVVLTQMMRR